MTWGSGDMVRQLLAAGLVDELGAIVHPAVLGAASLFGNNAQPSAFTWRTRPARLAVCCSPATRAAARCAQERSKMLSNDQCSKGMHSGALSRGTLRPNNSFKPMPLRGTA